MHGGLIDAANSVLRNLKDAVLARHAKQHLEYLDLVRREGFMDPHRRLKTCQHGLLRSTLVRAVGGIAENIKGEIVEGKTPLIVIPIREFYDSDSDLDEKDQQAERRPAPRSRQREEDARDTDLSRDRHRTTKHLAKNSEDVGMDAAKAKPKPEGGLGMARDSVNTASTGGELGMGADTNLGADRSVNTQRPRGEEEEAPPRAKQQSINESAEQLLEIQGLAIHLLLVSRLHE